VPVAEPAPVASADRADTPEELIEQMKVPMLEVRLSTDLVGIVSGSSDDLIARVRALRRKIAGDLGIVVPPVRTRDHIELPPSTYAIRVAGVEVGRGIAPNGKVLALGDYLDALPGETTEDPVFGLSGKWIPAELRQSAELSGATVIDRVSVLVTHLQSVIVQNAARLLSREDVRVLTEAVRQENPAAVEELVPAQLSLAEVQRVLQGLLAEEVPINDLGRIYEALALRAKVSLDPEGLIEAARGALGPALAARHLENGVLRVIMIAPELEQSMLEVLRPSEHGSQLLLDQGRLDAVLGSLRNAVQTATAAGSSVVLVCAPALRPAVQRLIAGQGFALPVLSYQEVTVAKRPIDTVGLVNAAQTIAS
jgi:flagellar biosynthesis protein FlhA